MADYDKYTDGENFFENSFWLREASRKILRKYDAPRNPLWLKETREDEVENYSNYLDPYLTDNINEKIAFGDDATELTDIARAADILADNVGSDFEE